MSKTAQTAILQNKNLILAAVFGFGGMLTAILASIAVVTPLVNAQVNSALALQTARAAQVSSIQGQPVASVTPTGNCNAPVAQSAHVDHEAPEHKGGKGAGLWAASSDWKMDWKKSAYAPYGISNTHSGNTTTNTTTTTNNTNTTTNTNVTIRDSFNLTENSGNTEINDSFNNNAIGNTTTVSDSFNTDNSDNSDNSNYTDNSNNSDNSVNISDSGNNNAIGNTVTTEINDSFNTDNSDNSINVSDNTVTVLPPTI